MMRLIRMPAAIAFWFCLAGIVGAQPAVDKLEQDLLRDQKRADSDDPATDEPAPGPPPPQLPDAPEEERPEPGYLGAITDDRQKAAGVRIVELVEGGPAETAGLRKNDLITAIDGAPVHAMSDMAARITDSAPGDTLVFEIERGAKPGKPGEKLEFEVTLGVRPPAAERPFPQFGRIPAEDPKDAGLGRPPGALLGVSTVALDASGRERLEVPVGRGARVVAVALGSPAERAGVPVDAVIVAVDGRAVDSPDDLAAQILRAGPNREVELAYYIGAQLMRQRVRLRGEAQGGDERIEALEQQVRTLEARVSALEKLLKARGKEK